MFISTLINLILQNKKEKEKEITICHLLLIILSPTLFYTVFYTISGIVN